MAVIGHCSARFHVWPTGFVFCRSQWLTGFQISIVYHIQETGTNYKWPVQRADCRTRCPALPKYLFQALYCDLHSLIKSTYLMKNSNSFILYYATHETESIIHFCLRLYGEFCPHSHSIIWYFDNFNASHIFLVSHNFCKSKTRLL